MIVNILFFLINLFLSSGILLILSVRKSKKERTKKEYFILYVFSVIVNLVFFYCLFAKIQAMELPFYMRICTRPWNYLGRWRQMIDFRNSLYLYATADAAALIICFLIDRVPVTSYYDHKRKDNIKWILLFIFLNFALAGKYSLLWAYRTFNKIPFEEVLINLLTPLKDASENGVVVDYLNGLKKWYIPYIALELVLICLILLFRRGKLKENREKETSAAWNPDKCLRIGILLTSFFMLFAELYTSNVFFSIDEYIYGYTHQTMIYDDYYVSPETTKIQFPEKKKNLIMIYAESMETTYASIAEGGGYQENHIPELTKLAKEEQCFGMPGQLNGGFEVKNVGCTIASMVAQTAGLPLNVPFGANNYDQYSTFLPGIKNLGDIFSDEGYEQYLLMGSDSAFAGFQTYLKTHGNYQILDYEELKKENLIAEDYFVNWGVEDRTLFEIAKQELSEIAKEDKPFQFAMQTIDTHFPDGYVDDKDQIVFDTQMENAIYNADQKISDFVKWIQSQDFYEDTVIVITGDHYNMSAQIENDTQGICERKTVCIVIHSDTERKREEEQRLYSNMDVFPTVLAAIGCQIDGNRLGLGVNLYSDEDTLIEKLGLDHLNEELGKKSSYYDEFLYGK